VQELGRKSQVLDDKARFVREVVDGTLVVFKRSRADIEADLLKAYLKGPDGTFDHLMNIKTYQYTTEAIKELGDAATRTRAELKVLQGQSLIELWKADFQ
jgi:DNA topoisomerase-2